MPYVAGRARRIIPPYFFIVLTCALGLSAISTLSFSDYFFNIQWLKYLISNLCFMNFVEPTLPGVFCDNEIQAVNGSLWTLKVEWAMYLSIPILCYIAKRMKISIIYIIAAICIGSTTFREIMMYKYEQTGSSIYSILGRQFMGQMLYFLIGTTFYILRDKIMAHGKVFFITSVSIFASAIIYDHIDMGINATDILVFHILYPIALTSMLLYISTCRIQFSALKISNFSYEIYLFHFPIIQVIYYYWNGSENRNILFATTIAIIMLSGYIFNLLHNHYQRKKRL